MREAGREAGRTTGRGRGRERQRERGKGREREREREREARAGQPYNYVCCSRHKEQNNNTTNTHEARVERGVKQESEEPARSVSECCVRAWWAANQPKASTCKAGMAWQGIILAGFVSGGGERKREEWCNPENLPITTQCPPDR